MKIKILVSDFVENEDGGHDIVHYIEEKDIPDDQVRDEDICTICGFPDYPECKKTCHNFRDKDEEALVKELEILLREIWDDDEFVIGVISSVCAAQQEEEMIRFIKESENPTSDIVSMYATDLHQGSIVGLNFFGEVKEMQMCPFCDNVYDESEYTHCPYCSGDIDEEEEEVRVCPVCHAGLYWDDDEWVCSNCDYTEDD